MLQYCYPSGDYAYTSFIPVGPDQGLWGQVNEGVATYDDTDYIQGTVFGNTGSTQVDFYTNPLNVLPNDYTGAWLNIRASVYNEGGGSYNSGVIFHTGGIQFTGVDQSGTIFFAKNASSMAIPSGGFNSYTFPLTNISHSGQVQNQFFGNITSKLLLYRIDGLDETDILDISAVEVVFSGDNAIHPNNNTTLFLQGPLVANSGINLFINGVQPTGLANGIPLVIFGEAIANSGLDLFLQANAVTNATDLYIHGQLPSSGITPLVTVGGWPSGILPLSIRGPITYPSNSGTTLFTYSTPNSGLFNTAPLFIGSDGLFSGILPLYLAGPQNGNTNSYLPLVVYNDNTSKQALQLFLQNNGGLFGSGINLRTVGAGHHTGWSICNSEMNLYLGGVPGTTNTTPLFLQGPSGIYNSTNLYISGGLNSNSSVNLYCSGVGLLNSGVSLFVRGF